MNGTGERYFALVIEDADGLAVEWLGDDVHG